MSVSSPYHHPSWMHRDKAHDKRSDSVVSRYTPTSSPDFGPENFSYDPTFLSAWRIPDGIVNKEKTPFPQILKFEINDWSLAGAALDTALDRIARLKMDAIKRGWPRAGGSFARLSRSSDADETEIAAARSDDCSPLSSPLALSETADHPAYMLTPPSTAVAASGIVPPVPTPVGPESPSVSPGGPSAPVDLANDTKAILSDLSRLPPSSLPIRGPRFDAPNALGDSSGSFDENAWETYLNSFRAELSDVRHHALGRLKGFTRTIDRLVVEYGHMNDFKAGVAAFQDWWLTAKPKVAEYEGHVHSLDAPELEQVKKQRQDLGLPV